MFSLSGSSPSIALSEGISLTFEDHTKLVLQFDLLSAKPSGTEVGPGPEFPAQYVAISASLKDVAQSLRTELRATADAIVDEACLAKLSSRQNDPDPLLDSVMVRAAWRDQIIASTSMISAKQACGILKLATKAPSSTMTNLAKRKNLLRFMVNGTPAYPSFQFDQKTGRIHQVVLDICSKRPDSQSDLMLLAWFLEPSVELGRQPIHAIETEPERVLAIFKQNQFPLA